MSESQFSRLDWRAGKRRRTQPRVRDYGGQKEATRRIAPAGATPEKVVHCLPSTHRRARAILTTLSAVFAGVGSMRLATWASQASSARRFSARRSYRS
jgi:hypothetical protein